MTDSASPFQAPKADLGGPGQFDSRLKIQGVFASALSGLAALIGTINFLGLFLSLADTDAANTVHISYAFGSLIGTFVVLGIQISFIYAGIRMIRKTVSYAQYRATGIFLCIPCISPLVILGIPLGIWMLFTLNDPHFKEALGET